MKTKKQEIENPDVIWRNELEIKYTNEVHEEFIKNLQEHIQEIKEHIDNREVDNELLQDILNGCSKVKTIIENDFNDKIKQLPDKVIADIYKQAKLKRIEIIESISEKITLLKSTKKREWSPSVDTSIISITEGVIDYDRLAIEKKHAIILDTPEKRDLYQELKKLSSELSNMEAKVKKLTNGQMHFCNSDRYSDTCFIKIHDDYSNSINPFLFEEL